MFNLEIDGQKVKVYFSRKGRVTNCFVETPTDKISASVICYYKDMYNKQKGMLLSMEKAIKKTGYASNIRRKFYEKFFSIISTKKLN